MIDFHRYRPDAECRAELDDRIGELNLIDDEINRLRDRRADLFTRRKQIRDRIGRLRRRLGIVECPPAAPRRAA